MSNVAPQLTLLSLDIKTHLNSKSIKAHETQVQHRQKWQCYATPHHNCLRFINLNSRGQPSTIYRASHPLETLSHLQGWILTSIDDGVHLQDRDVSFVERHFITQASSTSQFLSVLLLICKRMTTMTIKFWMERQEKKLIH